MIFTHLKMTGFKSFAEPEHISIEDGLTGIVGPNGCGKSNIVESLRWLMGESSAKSMRGGELEDVIFDGTASRPSRNFAEVTLTIDNSSRKAPASLNDSDEIEVTRRIDRGKGSQFRINGKIARAKDVQLLFADMATGPRSSGIVSQGKVDALINAKPRDRRSLLEEAANIRGLHQRRHEAELRLNTAETNLDRLEDILIQLDEQKASLIKQARQAARYRSVADRIRKADAHLLLARFTATLGRVDQTETLLREAERLAAQAAEDAAARARLRNDAADALPPLRQTEAEKAAELQRLTLARTELDNEEARALRAMEDVERRQTQITTDISRENQLLADAEEALASLRAEAERITADDQTDAPRLADAAEALKTARSEADEAERALADAAAKNRAVERETENINRRIEELSRRLGQIEENQAEIDIPRLERDAASASEIRRKAEEDAGSIKALLAEAETRTEAARITAATTMDSRSNDTEVLARTRAEAQALKSLLAVGEVSEKTPVSQDVKVDKGFEDALAAALGDGLAAPRGQDRNGYWLEAGTSQDAGCPLGASPLTDHLSAPKALDAALSGIGIARDAAEAEKLQPGLKPGQALTTREGGLWRWDGFVQPVGSETAAAQRLRQEARLRELEDILPGIEAKAETAQQQLDAAIEARKASEAESLRLRDDERRLDQHLLNAVRDDEKAGSALAAARQRIDELENAHREAKHALAEVEKEAQDIRDVAALAEAVARATQTAEEKRQQLADAMGAERSIRNARSMRETRRNEIMRETASWTERQQGAGKQLEELARRQSSAVAEAETLAGMPEEIRRKREDLADLIEKAEDARRKAADLLAEAETRLRLADEAVRGAESAHAQAREETIRCESQRNLHLQEQATLVDRIRERLNASPDALAEIAGLKPDEMIDTTDDAIAVLEQRHERLIRERENVGPVNLRAEDEMKEVEERIAGIETERDDLIAAIAKLRTAINQLNREGRERLLKSFADVNRYFGTLFNTLFNGGTAELSLTEEEDPLEAGLEILASPPGKKLQSLSLLSGGEKALTAIALIFAVFMTNPSPICILDEVDAPLDDSNVARFCDILEQISDKTGTRFIIVTHHRLTMARMDRLYGVTMEQKGVSRVVSVDLQHAEKFDKSA
ncbi:chromosome segregation protein SMC [Alphaproteobacteria bacterium LSUCC0684]